MAKKAPGDRSPKNKERQDPGFRTIGIRVSDEYAAWLNELAKFDRTTVAAMFDRAILNHAKSLGFSKPAPERTG